MATSGNFVQLHNHTHYSLLDGASKIPDLAKRAAKELGMPAVGITDHGNMHGAYEMCTNCGQGQWRQAHHRHRSVCDPGNRTPRSRPASAGIPTGSPISIRKHRRRNPDDVSGGGLITHLDHVGRNRRGPWSTSSKPRPLARTSRDASCDTPEWIRRCSPPIPKA